MTEKSSIYGYYETKVDIRFLRFPRFGEFSRTKTTEAQPESYESFSLFSFAFSKLRKVVRSRSLKQKSLQQPPLKFRALNPDLL